MHSLFILHQNGVMAVAKLLLCYDIICEHCIAASAAPGGSGGGGGGDSTLEGMIKAGSLGIQLLPRCALKGLVLLTDGISGFSSPASMHSNMTTLTSSNISCWVVHVGGAPHPSDALGLVPDTETIKFISRACNGCVMQPHQVSRGGGGGGGGGHLEGGNRV